MGADLILMDINDIEAAFGKAKYPDQGFPGEIRPSEWEYVYDRLRGKDWHDLAVEDIDAQGGVHEGISCLSADTFVYFLPGLMKLALNDTETISIRYAIVDAIVSRLTRSDYQYKTNAHGHLRRRQQRRTERELQKSLAEQESVLALLSPKQRQFLVKFLHYATQQEPTMCPVVVNSAIQNLEQGRIEAYRQDDVLQWVQLKRQARPAA